MARCEGEGQSFSYKERREGKREPREAFAADAARPGEGELVAKGEKQLRPSHLCFVEGAAAACMAVGKRRAKGGGAVPEKVCNAAENTDPIWERGGEGGEK